MGRRGAWVTTAFAAALGGLACDSADGSGLLEPNGATDAAPRDLGDTGVHDTGVRDLGVMDIGRIDAGGCACLPPVDFGRYACGCDVVEWGCEDDPQTFQLTCDVPPAPDCYGHEVDPVTGCAKPVFYDCFKSCLSNFDAG